MTEEALTSLVLVIRLGLVTILLWILSRVWDIWRDWDKRKKQRAAYIRALFAEIDFNTADMSRFLGSAPALSVFEKLFENPHFIPHITDARHTDVYRTSMAELSVLSDDLIGDIVRFYGDLEKVRNQISGLLLPSFVVISTKGKVGTIGNIYRTCQDSEKLGVRILADMGRQHSNLGLQRRHPPQLSKPLETDVKPSQRHDTE